MAATRPLFGDIDFEDRVVLGKLNTIFNQKRGFTFRMPKPGSPVLLVVSGGLDSVLLWFRLLHVYKLQVYPVFFTYPFFNSNSIPGEWNSVRFFYSYLKKRYAGLVMPITTIPVDLSFSLTNKKNMQILKHNWRISIANAKQEVETQKASVYLLDYPNRFARFALSAYEYGLSLQARGIDVSTLFLGVVPNDSAIGREPTLSVLRSINTYICLVLGDWKWQINAPIDKANSFYFTKEQSIHLATESNLPIHKTWSCVNKLLFHCGWCNACRYRQASFQNSGIEDKTRYVVSPQLKSIIKSAIARLFQRGTQTYKKKPQKKVPDRQLVIPSEFRVELCAGIDTFQQDSNLFLRNSSTEEVVQINDVGSYIFARIKSMPGIHTRKLVDGLKRKFPQTPIRRIQKDVSSFLAILIDKKMVRQRT